MQTLRSRRVEGSTSSSTTVASRRCCHRCETTASETAFPVDPTGPGHEARTTTTPTQYPIGWIHRHRRRLPAVSVGSSAEATMPSPSIRSPECPADVRSGWNPAATLPPQRDPHRPCQTRDSRYCRDAKHADWSRITTRLAPGDAPWRPRRASLAPATSHVSMLGNPNGGVDSRRSERVATLVAEQHANVPRRRPSSAESRIVRAEARPLRSSASLGGLDASADTNHRVPDRRLDTTDHPHDVGTGDVATTTPARATR
jgi:hypothetical protein